MSEHTQVASYALGLLDPIEMTNFEVHLAECDECADQLEWLLPVAGQLADVEPGDLYGVSGPSAFTVPPSSQPQQHQQPGPPAAAPTSQYPADYPPASQFQSTDYPSGEVPAAGPTRSPWTGEVPVRSPRTGEIPTRGPRTGEMPVSGRRSGEVPTRGPRSGEVPTRGPRTGEIPLSGPPSGENRIVPLVRGGDPRRRQQPQPQPQPQPQAYEPYESVQPQPHGRSRRPDELSSRRRSGALLLASAAAVIGAVAGAGAVVAGPWSGGDQGNGTAIERVSGDKLAATDGKSGVSSNVVLSKKPWGTLVSFDVSELDGPRNCRLVMVRADGGAEVLSTWTVPKQGYGAGTKPPKLSLQASTSVQRKDIAELQVQDVRKSGNTTLVTIPT
jgi:hypothetical protein